MAAKTSARQVIASKMKQGQGGLITVVNDGRDCPECAAQSGQFRNFTGTRVPPFHPNCRCSLK